METIMTWSLKAGQLFLGKMENVINGTLILAQSVKHPHVTVHISSDSRGKYANI